MNRWSGLGRALAALAAVTLAAACGGGGGSAGDTIAGGVDTGGTGAPASFARGPIIGFGSIIVGAVRFDDTDATVVDADGRTLQREALGLGTMVEVEAGAITLGATGKAARATRIRIGSEIVGPVQSIDAAGGRVTVLGQQVVVGPATAFDASLAGGLAALRVGQVVEVHALPDGPGGRYVATRIEPRPDAGAFRLRGQVAALDPAARRFSIGGATLSYAGLPAAPEALAVGRFVGVRLATVPVAGVWTVLAAADGSGTPARDVAEIEITGLVTALQSAGRFTVDGVEVDARGAAFEDGPVSLGSRVKVEGALVAGVLVAREVELEDDARSSSFRLEGRIVAVDRGARTFTLRGLTVRWSAATAFDDGTADSIAPGARVEVVGTLAPGGTELAARRIEFD